MQAVPRSHQQIHTSTESSADGEHFQSVLHSQATFKTNKWEGKKEHMKSSLFCRSQESLWDQRGLGPFHTLGFIQKMMRANASSTNFSPGGFQSTLNSFGDSEPKLLVYLHPEDTTTRARSHLPASRDCQAARALCHSSLAP